MSDKQITWIAISVSVLLHLVLAGFLLFGPNIESNKKPVKPVAIKAKVIDLKPQSPVKTPKKTADAKALERKKQLQEQRELQKQREQQKKLEQQKERLKQLEKKRQAKKLAEEKAKKEKALREKKEKQRKEKLKKEQEKKERERKEKQRKEKERLEKQKKEKERKEKERKERERKEKQRKEDARKKQEQAERDALAQAMADEEAEFQAEENERLAAEYSGSIKKKISRNWNRPPNTQNGMVVELLIELLSNGMVSSVSISKSSGDDRFDRSAVNAVNKAEQFPALADAPPEVFETYFRRFTLKFKPEDLAR